MVFGLWLYTCQKIAWLLGHSATRFMNCFVGRKNVIWAGFQTSLRFLTDLGKRQADPNFLAPFFRKNFSWNPIPQSKTTFRSSSLKHSPFLPAHLRKHHNGKKVCSPFVPRKKREKLFQIDKGALRFLKCVRECATDSERSGRELLVDTFPCLEHFNGDLRRLIRSSCASGLIIIIIQLPKPFVEVGCPRISRFQGEKFWGLEGSPRVKRTRRPIAINAKEGFPCPVVAPDWKIAYRHRHVRFNENFHPIPSMSWITLLGSKEMADKEREISF